MGADRGRPHFPLLRAPLLPGPGSEALRETLWSPALLGCRRAAARERWASHPLRSERSVPPHTSWVHLTAWPGPLTQAWALSPQTPAQRRPSPSSLLTLQPLCTHTPSRAAAPSPKAPQNPECPAAAVPDAPHAPTPSGSRVLGLELGQQGPSGLVTPASGPPPVTLTLHLPPALAPEAPSGSGNSPTFLPQGWVLTAPTDSASVARVCAPSRPRNPYTTKTIRVPGCRWGN